MSAVRRLKASASASASVSVAPRADLFDLQVNGYAGVDFQQPDLSAAALAKVVRALHARRTSRILVTLITDSIERLCVKLRQFEAFRKKNAAGAATFVGYHLEGPYLNQEPGFKGAHEERFMHDPSIADFERLQDAAGGNIRLMTIAPELKGSPEFIVHLVKRGVRVAIGHSNADDSAIDEAIAAGLTLCTHLGNAVPQQVHRHDNIMQRLLARDELCAVFIPDGIHLPPHVLKNFVHAKPRNKVLFTTDCMAAAASKPGRYRIAHMEVDVGADGIVRLPGETRAFAGSSLTMDNAFANIQRFTGWSETEAHAACSTRVAKYLGL
ncbi:N-acetylglucosamine-6-phosphate deacetylase [Nibricoccus aquaticus]|uniref:N-acetylglucosamine-6-phosphate deacetylase n=1 Tax=Nibricoccus aquaticus TaxID=2576891 RepID=A0A290QE86_9BACT|nr:N-acetylglucosamine-6-phosphate deacetylase [Nibricoccus aquaticus]ATC65540.1 N-acetylglucosamine-6-phosphate deacetylase [Nibricoccus aquaticus]